MKQNNRKTAWKAVVAVVLVMASLFTVSTMVSASFVEEVLEEVFDMMSLTSSNTGTCKENPTVCPGCNVKTQTSYICVPGCTNRHHKKPLDLGTCQCWPEDT